VGPEDTGQRRVSRWELGRKVRRPRQVQKELGLPGNHRAAEKTEVREGVPGELGVLSHFSSLSRKA
jgi:hypothetical protein